MKRNNPGFTLIELVLVGALLAVLAGLTVPGVRGGFRRFSEERASSELEELSRYARSVAIMRGNPYRMSFSKEERSYRLLQSDGRTFFPMNGNVGRPHPLPEEVSVQGPSLHVTFFPNGAAEGGPIEFNRAHEPLWRFEVDPFLGEPKVTEIVSETAG